MRSQEYQENRRSLPASELAKYAGQWVAFSMDGRRVIAGAETIGKLEERLAALGEDPQQVVLGHIPGPEDDLSLGAAEMY